MLRCGMNALAMPLRSMKIQSAPGMIHSWRQPDLLSPDLHAAQPRSERDIQRDVHPGKLGVRLRVQAVVVGADEVGPRLWKLDLPSDIEPIGARLAFRRHVTDLLLVVAVLRHGQAVEHQHPAPFRTDRLVAEREPLFLERLLLLGRGRLLLRSAGAGGGVCALIATPAATCAVDSTAILAHRRNLIILITGGPRTCSCGTAPRQSPA